jgi:transcription-repair coupling factor (superfamily II helicase)
LFKLKIEDQSQIKLAEKLNISKTHLLKGLFGSGISLRIANQFRTSKKNFLFTLNDAEQAAYFLNDLEHLSGEENILFFPSSKRKAYSQNNIDNSNVLQRSSVLKQISDKKQKIIVTYPEALFEKIISKKTLKKNTLTLKKGMNISLDFINESLFEYGFEKVDFVSSPGDFSVRGGIIDVYSYSNQHPYRIEFFSDTINSLRTFDVKSQLSISNIDIIDLIPNTSSILINEERQSLIDLLPIDSVLITLNVDKIANTLDILYKKSEESFGELNSTVQNPPERLFLNSVEWINSFKNNCHLVLNRSDFLKPDTITRFNQKPQPTFNKNFNFLVKHFNKNHKNGIVNYILCTNSKQVKRLNDIFQEMDEVVHYKISECPIHSGFEDMESKIACFTDHEIFGRYHKYKLKSDKIKRDSINLRELTNMQVGDYVTHIDHGIGKFGGLQTIQVEKSKQEAVKVVYGEGDVLYISIHSLHKISKFNGKDGHKPRIYKLGSKSWKILKQKTKSKLKSLAFDLIKLYAKRKKKIGYAFAPDSYLQWELEASFLFEDTPDQTKATKEIKIDMESERTMDRLVCGDVGFGKTEVAIRAAFKAVDNSKQVAILVPTTILSFQHFKTFTSRLKEFPLRVDYINRFRSTKEKKQIYEDISNGKIDIIIGTHQLTNKSIIFNDLGLLIVDEEQKFGVSVKESIRSIKNNIDVLSLTATPIPRTLQFSLMSARDLSIIATPPPNRFPIETEIIRFSETIIRDAIIYELHRGGQVFFVHNRVENINEVAGMLQRLVPDAKISIGHGQMDGKKLEKKLIGFMEGEFDILVATTIIENGLDVPNANTIFINNANNFGLSDLHQMRGRVGRSNKKAFCYFITPPINHISNEAQKRINAIQNYSELGSGIQIAMKDLEIRGAGDLLGAEQSGFINEIGFETYHKILNEAVDELKENEFKELYKNEKSRSKFKDVQIDTDLEILFPDNYINIISERLSLYNELSKINTSKGLLEFEKKIIDRFGPLPEEAEELLKSVEIKRIGSKIGIKRFIIKQGKCIGYFVENEESDVFKNSPFINFLNNIQNYSSIAVISKKKTKNGMKLALTIEKIDRVDTLLNILEDLIKDSSNP